MIEAFMIILDIVILLLIREEVCKLSSLYRKEKEDKNE